MLDLLGNALVNVAQWKYMLPLFAGTFVGMIGGSLPGVTITMTVIVVLPFTYGLDPLAGLAAMTGVYVGGSTGGLITCCLLGIPGLAGLDRHHVRRLSDGAQRRARPRHLARRLGIGVGRTARRTVPGLPHRAACGDRARVRSWEYFSLFVLAMAMVAGLTESSLLKGLISTAIGLFITVMGPDPIASVPRFTFGSDFIGGGFAFLPVLIGIFAFAQIMTDIEKLNCPADQAMEAVSGTSSSTSRTSR